LTTDEDLFDAVNLGRGLGWKRVQLVIATNGESSDESQDEEEEEKPVKKSAQKGGASEKKQQQQQQQQPQQQQQQQQHQHQQDIPAFMVVQPQQLPQQPVQPQPQPQSLPPKSEYLQIHPNYVIAGLSVALLAVVIFALRK